MKVFEMIKELSNYDPHMEVTITDGLPIDGIERSYRGDFDLCDFDSKDGKRILDIGIGGSMEYAKDQSTGKFIFTCEGFAQGATADRLTAAVNRVVDEERARNFLFNWLTEFVYDGSTSLFLENEIWKRTARNNVDMAVDILYSYNEDPNFDQTMFSNLLDELIDL